MFSEQKQNESSRNVTMWLQDNLRLQHYQTGLSKEQSDKIPPENTLKPRVLDLDPPNSTQASMPAQSTFKSEFSSHQLMTRLQHLGASVLGSVLAQLHLWITPMVCNLLGVFTVTTFSKAWHSVSHIFCSVAFRASVKCFLCSANSCSLFSTKIKKIK